MFVKSLGMANLEEKYLVKGHPQKSDEKKSEKCKYNHQVGQG